MSEKSLPGEAVPQAVAAPEAELPYTPAAAPDLNLPEGIVSVDTPPPTPMILGGIGLIGTLASLPYVRAFVTHNLRQLRNLFPRKPGEEPQTPQTPKGE